MILSTKGMLFLSCGTDGCLKHKPLFHQSARFWAFYFLMLKNQAGIRIKTYF